MVKLIKLKKLQNLTHSHCPYGHNTMGYLYLNLLTFFLGRNFTCSHYTNDKWDKGIMETHPNATAVNFRLSF